MASEKRERELARARLARQQQRREAQRRARRRRQVVLSSVVAGLLLVGGLVYLGQRLAGDDADTLAGDTPATDAPATDAPGAGGPCAYPENEQDTSEEGARDVGTPPVDDVDTTTPYTGTITLTQGVVEVAYDTAKAPCTVNSFRHLAAEKYFDDTECHRLTTQGIFVLQCGDPTGTGRSGPGYSFADENTGTSEFPRGTVAMANSGPNTNGSQFFLVYKDTSLPPNYAVIGKITKGLEVLDAIAKAGQDDGNGPGDGRPKQPVKIQTFTMEPSA